MNKKQEQMIQALGDEWTISVKGYGVSCGPITILADNNGRGYISKFAAGGKSYASYGKTPNAALSTLCNGLRSLREDCLTKMDNAERTVSLIDQTLQKYGKAMEQVHD